MSIIIGKRNFTENFTDFGLSDFAFNQLYVTKKSKLADVSSKNEFNILNKASKQNVELLKGLYPAVNEQEISSILFDCDENVSIAKEILSKQTQSSHQNMETQDSPQIKGLIPDRKIYSLKIPKSIGPGKNFMGNTELKNNQGSKQSMITVEAKSDNQIKIQEEEPINLNRNEEIKNLSDFIIGRLFQMNDLEETKSTLQTILKEYQGEVDKKHDVHLRKIMDEKALLVKVFTQQREKVNKLTKQTDNLQNQVENSEQEINKLRLINYKLGLRLKSLDLSEEEKAYFQIC